MNNDPDIFNIDLFTSSRESLEKISGKKYEDSEEIRNSFRVVLDHVRAAVFLIDDGILPSNKDQGYFVRRLIRRAVLHGSRLGIDGKFTHRIAESFLKTYSGVYLDVKRESGEIMNAIADEEAKFLEEALEVFKK